MKKILTCEAMLGLYRDMKATLLKPTFCLLIPLVSTEAETVSAGHIYTCKVYSQVF